MTHRTRARRWASGAAALITADPGEATPIHTAVRDLSTRIGWGDIDVCCIENRVGGDSTILPAGVTQRDAIIRTDVGSVGMRAVGSGFTI